MLSAKDCLARAAEMERSARSCDTKGLKADMMSMAETWRHLAQQALWQDSMAVQTVHDSGRE